jgi:hypothetical protein
MRRRGDQPVALGKIGAPHIHGENRISTGGALEERREEFAEYPELTGKSYPARVP